PDGRTLAIARHHLDLLDVATGRMDFLPQARVRHVAFAHQGRWLAAGGETLQVWDLANRRVLWHSGLPGGGLECLQFSPDDQTLATAADNGTVRLWGAHTGKVRNNRNAHDGRIAWSVAFAPDGRTLATAGDDGTVRLWDPDWHAESRLLVS